MRTLTFNREDLERLNACLLDRGADKYGHFSSNSDAAYCLADEIWPSNDMDFVPMLVAMALCGAVPTMDLNGEGLPLEGVERIVLLPSKGGETVKLSRTTLEILEERGSVTEWDADCSLADVIPPRNGKTRNEWADVLLMAMSGWLRGNDHDEEVTEMRDAIDAIEVVN